MADSELLDSITRAIVAAGFDHAGLPWLLIAPRGADGPLTASSTVGSELGAALIGAGFVVLAAPDLSVVRDVDAEVEIDEFGARVRLSTDAEIGLVGAVPARVMPDNWTNALVGRDTLVVMIALGVDLAAAATRAGSSPDALAGSIDLVAACEVGDVLAGTVTVV